MPLLRASAEPTSPVASMFKIVFCCEVCNRALTKTHTSAAPGWLMEGLPKSVPMGVLFCSHQAAMRRMLPMLSDWGA